MWRFFYLKLQNLLVILQNKTKRDLKKKFELFFIYSVLVFKYIFVLKLLKRNPTKQKIFGLSWRFFSFSAFVCLFEDMFINRHYYFRSEIKSPVIIVGGANIGMSVLYLKLLYPHAKITAFEPDKKTFAILKKNIESNNLKNIILFNSAISDRQGTVNLYRDSEDPGSFLMSIKKERYFRKFVKVKSVLLSGHIKSRVDLLLLDIEGAEEEVFYDLDKTGKIRVVKKIIAEYHHHIDKNRDSLANLLIILQKNNFGYQITTLLKPPPEEKIYQDLLVYAYKKSLKKL